MKSAVPKVLASSVSGWIVKSLYLCSTGRVVLRLHYLKAVD